MRDAPVQRGEVQMEISCAFPTTLDSPEQVALEELGYQRAWLMTRRSRARTCE
jgi:hypothetical protein